MKAGSRTPWGKADEVEVLAPGVQRVSTPSHGGIKLDKHRNGSVHEAFRKADGWYEEDLEWAVVALTFPDLFEPKERDLARGILINHYPDEYTAATGFEVTPAQSRTLRERAFKADSRDKFVAASAWGDWHPNVPKNSVGVVAKNEAKNEERYFLIPKTEYAKTSEFGFIVDESRYPTWAGPSAPPQKPITVRRYNFQKIAIDDHDYDASYLEDEGAEDRLQAFRAGLFTFLAIKAEVEILIPDAPTHGGKYPSPRRDMTFITQTITSPGLYGVASDSSIDDMNEIFNKECQTLERMLTALGVVIED
jgi:hypothetical protein